MNAIKNKVNTAKKSAKKVVNSAKKVAKVARNATNGAGNGIGFAEIKADLTTIMSDFESLSDHADELVGTTKTSLAEGLKLIGKRVEKLGKMVHLSSFSKVGKTLGKLSSKVEHLRQHH